MRRSGPIAPRGTAEKHLNFALPMELWRAAAKGAKATGVTTTEWIRQAMRQRLEREA